MTNFVRPQPFVLVASDHGSMIVNRLDSNKAPSGAEYGVGHQIFTSGAYDPAEVAQCCEILRDARGVRGPGVIMLDCGANIGVHTVECAKLMTGWGSVLAFEAQERIFYALAGNIALNNCFNAFARRVALADVDGVLRVPVPDYTRSASFGSLELEFSARTEHIGQSISYAEKHLTSVNTLAIDGLNLPRVDFIKLDVEGMELKVLEGARGTIRRCRPIMLIEFIKVGEEALRDALQGLGYSWTRFGGNLLAQPNV